MRVVERVLNMKGGSVLDFSDRTFDEFIAHEVGIDATAPRFSEDGGSKAKRLRRVLQSLAAGQQAKLLRAFLDYRDSPGRDDRVDLLDDEWRASYENIVRNLEEQVAEADNTYAGGAHHWARELQAMGHEVRLIRPAYVKPFVKRHKNDAVDAEAICEAAQRPTMRFVAVKSEEQQAAALVFRTRDLLVKQHTRLGNAIREHLTEYGWVAPKGPSHLAMLADLLDDSEMATTLPEAARPMFAMMVDMLAELDRRVAALDKEIARRAREDEVARRLMTIPGVGPITATAIAAIAPPAETFAKGRDFAAWLVPKQVSTGGEQKARFGKRADRQSPRARTAQESETKKTDCTVR